jgi:SAM-dependent methyltransferase
VTADSTFFDRRIRPRYRHAKSYVERWSVDWRRGIDTAHVVFLSDLGYSYHEQVTYEASGWHELTRALPPAETGPQDVFVDIGSGMGRVVFEAASEYPFRRVIGVELMEELHRVAVGNIERNRARLHVDDVELLCEDASVWPLPADVSVVYMCNPVLGARFGRLLGHIVSSLEQHPRRMRIVYRAPVEHAQLMATGRFELRRVVPTPFPRRLWTRAQTNVYETLP